jgi:hypothetical protein
MYVYRILHRRYLQLGAKSCVLTVHTVWETSSSAGRCDLGL